MVDIEHLNRDATDCGSSNKPRPAPAEMIVPKVATRMKEPRELTRLSVQPGKIWAFAPIAPRASDGEIVELRLAEVLLGDDVIDLECPRVRCLRETAILTSSLRSLANAPLEFNRYGHVGISGRSVGMLDCLASLRLKNGQEIPDMD